MALTLTPKSDTKSQRQHKQAEYTSSCKHEQEQEPPWSQLTGICTGATDQGKSIIFHPEGKERAERTPGNEAES